MYKFSQNVEATIETTICLICLEYDIGCGCWKPESRKIKMNLTDFMYQTLVVVEKDPDNPTQLIDKSSKLARELDIIRKNRTGAQRQLDEHDKKIVKMDFES